MLILSLLLGLGLGLLVGGRLENLAWVRLRWIQLLFLGLVLRYATEYALENGNDIADAFRLPLFTLGFGMLLAGLWANRQQPGIAIAFVGILLNAVAIISNRGFMPVWQPSILAAGLPATEVGSAFHRIVGLTTAGGGIPGDFLAQAGPLGDIIPIPIPFLRNVASIGDLFLAAGLAFFLFATVVRHPAEQAEEQAAAEAAAMFQTGALAPAPQASGVTFERFDGGLVSALELERPLSLGGPSVGSEGTLRRT